MGVALETAPADPTVGWRPLSGVLVVPCVEDQSSEQMTVVQAGPFTADQARWIIGCFESPGHPLHTALGPGIVIEIGQGAGVCAVILMSFLDPEALPLSVAVSFSLFLNEAFTFTEQWEYDTDRIVFVNGAAKLEQYLRRGLVVRTVGS
jgi:hypothetical protein